MARSGSFLKIVSIPDLEVIFIDLFVFGSRKLRLLFSLDSMSTFPRLGQIFLLVKTFIQTQFSQHPRVSSAPGPAKPASTEFLCSVNWLPTGPVYSKHPLRPLLTSSLPCRGTSVSLTVPTVCVFPFICRCPFLFLSHIF